MCHFIVGQEFIVQDIFQALRNILMLNRGALFKKFKIFDSSFKIIYPEYSVSKDVNEETMEDMNGDEHFTRKEIENKDNDDLGQNESLIEDTVDIQNEYGGDFGSNEAFDTYSDDIENEYDGEFGIKEAFFFHNAAVEN